MIANDIDEPLFEGRERIVKDWNWWSDFLQREYYAAELEKSAWDTAAGAVARAVELEPGKRVLDLGAGSGEMAFRLALRGADMTGVERSAELVEHCMREAVRRGIIARFVAADMFTWSPKEKFDVIISINTSFGYGTDRQNRALIGKIGKWLAPGGVFYLDLASADQAEAFGRWTDDLLNGTLVVHNEYDHGRREMISLPMWGAIGEEVYYVADAPEVVKLYERAELEELMRAAGMEPRRLDRGMGRRFKQTDDQMLTTWAARKK
jgi:SAM-dependent methyltransferase